jgi:hypothetical protein
MNASRFLWDRPCSKKKKPAAWAGGGNVVFFDISLK